MEADAQRTPRRAAGYFEAVSSGDEQPNPGPLNASQLSCSATCSIYGDAHGLSKSTYVRQGIFCEANGIEEQNPQSASALYVPLPLFT